MSGCTAHGVKLSAAFGCVEAFVHKTHSAAPWGGVMVAELTKQNYLEGEGNGRFWVHTTVWSPD